MVSRGLGLVMVAACGGSNGLPPDAAPVAPDAPFIPGPNLVTLDVYDRPSLLMYRDGTGPWTVPQTIATNSYELHITSAYDVVAVCENQFFGSDAVMLKQTYSDGPTAFVFCWRGEPGGSEPPPSTLSLTGQMLQPGELFFGDWQRSLAAPWTFELEVYPGTHDLIAYGAQRMVIRRDQVIDQPAVVPTIDLDAEGAAMTARTFTVDADRSRETVTSELDLETTNGFAYVEGDANTLRLPPSSLVQPTDRQQVLIAASTDKTYRGVSTELADQSAFSLMPALTGVTYTYPDNKTLWATWTELPAFSRIELDLYGLSGIQSVTVSASYVAETGTKHIAFEPLPVDYDPKWQVGLAGPYQRYLDVTERLSDSSYRFTATRESVNGGFVTRPAPSRAAIRKRAELERRTRR